MILAVFGISRSEAEIYDCCATDADGTLPSLAVRCAQNLGLDATAQRLSDLAALREIIQSPNPGPIAFVNLAPLIGTNVVHAVIIGNIDTAANSIQVIDPAYPPDGRRIWSIELFEIAWRLARFQIIFVMPKQ